MIKILLEGSQEVKITLKKLLTCFEENISKQEKKNAYEEKYK